MGCSTNKPISEPSLLINSQSSLPSVHNSSQKGGAIGSHRADLAQLQPESNGDITLPLVCLSKQAEAIWRDSNISVRVWGAFPYCGNWENLCASRYVDVAGAGGVWWSTVIQNPQAALSPAGMTPSFWWFLPARPSHPGMAFSAGLTLGLPHSELD